MESELPVDIMPMPMDSAEILQDFASSTAIDDPSFNETKTTEKTEGWCKKYCRWIPTSPTLLEEAEKKVLSYIKTPHKGQYVDIGAVDKQNTCKWSFRNKTEDRKIWTVEFNENKSESDEIPLVLVHGLCSSLGLWAMNVDALAENRKVYAIDLLGFGRSSRPAFSKNAAEAEEQHVEAIEAWRKEMKLERFVLLGHSMGGFLSAAYSLKYPERVANLVLADPWGFPKKPENVEEMLPKNSNRSTMTIKAIQTIGQKVNPLAIMRAAGPMGPGLIYKARPDLVLKFEALNQNGSASVAEYIYHANARNPTGETAFRTMMDYFGWAKNPMAERIQDLKPEVPLTMIYGGSTWLPLIPEEEIKQLRPPQAHVDVFTIPGAGHHVYVDDQNLFNSIVNKAGEFADKLFRTQ